MSTETVQRSVAQRQARLTELYALRRRVETEIFDERTSIAKAKAAAEAASARVAAGYVPVKPKVRPPARCGTDGGYYRHRRTLREEACTACQEAHAATERDRRRRAAASAAEIAREQAA